jgi:hypothetical protein
MPLHHDPTRGGQAENQKFDNWYNKTLESYEQFFGQTPPVEIWSTPEDRFGRDLHFVRVNTQHNWVLPKLRIPKGATVSVTVFLTLILGGCYIGSSQSNISPFAGTLLVLISLAAAFGVIRFIVEIVNSIKNPSVPRNKGIKGSLGNGCGSSGCGGWITGWSWGDSGGHGSGDDSGSSDSGSSGGGDSGCGGGGCGGCGGCGG